MLTETSMKHRDAMFLSTLLVSTLAVSGCGGDSGADAGPPVATMEVTPQSGTLAPGETLQLSATAKDSNDNVLTIAITWASGDDLVATVSNMGLVTAVDEGSVNITASADSTLTIHFSGERGFKFDNGVRFAGGTAGTNVMLFLTES